MTHGEWAAWARGLLRRCAEAENRIRAAHPDAEILGQLDIEVHEKSPADVLRESVEVWAFGNIAARSTALRAQTTANRANDGMVKMATEMLRMRTDEQTLRKIIRQTRAESLTLRRAGNPVHMLLGERVDVQLTPTQAARVVLLSAEASPDAD